MNRAMTQPLTAPTEHTDVLVVGAGLAGLRTATLLAERGHGVTLIERRRRLTEFIRTTGIFVRKTLRDYDLPTEHLGPPIRTMVLYPPSLQKPVHLSSERDEYRVGEMGPLYEHYAREAVLAGVDLRLGVRCLGPVDDAYLIRDDAGTRRIAARFIVGADGARSQVAKHLGLDLNTHLLVGAERVYPLTDPVGEPAFHCVVDPRLAPGYLAWTVNDGAHAHVGVAGYARRYPHGINHALESYAGVAPGLSPSDRAPAQAEPRGGPIPVGGLLRRISSPRGLLVGDAAGAVSPLTAGGLDPCLRLSDYAAETLHRALVRADHSTLRDYDGTALRSEFRGRLAMRHALAQIRTPAAAEAAFLGLRSYAGRAAARHILFADKSFPEPEDVRPRRRETVPVAR